MVVVLNLEKKMVPSPYLPLPCRQYHGSVVAGSRQQGDHPTPSSSSSTSFHVGADEKTMVESRDEDLEGFLTEESIRTAAIMRRRKGG